MSKEIIVNAHKRESRIAVREDGVLSELHIEREERVVGSIYMAKVESVHHGMDASFVDIGLDRNAFLYVGDIIPGGGDDEEGEGGGSGGQFDRRGRRSRPNVSIGQLVKRGQQLLVQVAKGPRGSKGARVSTRISLPGRYLVFMPDENSVGVSRKIDDPKERDRLKRIVESIRKPAGEGRPGYGLIVRTEAEDKTERELRQDLDFLERTWAEIKRKAAVTQAPQSGLSGPDPPFPHSARRVRAGRGQTHSGFGDRLQAGARTAGLLRSEPQRPCRAVRWRQADLREFRAGIRDRQTAGAARLAEIGRLPDYRSGRGAGRDRRELGALHRLDDGAERTRFSRPIWKPSPRSGGSYACATLGGILVLDLIDMDSATDRKQVETALDVALKHDKSRCKISHISPLGLVEMTRKRTGETVNEQMNEPCPYCQGTGKLPSAESVSIVVARDLRRMARTQTNRRGVPDHLQPAGRRVSDRRGR